MQENAQGKQSYGKQAFRRDPFGDKGIGMDASEAICWNGDDHGAGTG